MFLQTLQSVVQFQQPTKPMALVENPRFYKPYSQLFSFSNPKKAMDMIGNPSFYKPCSSLHQFVSSPNRQWNSLKFNVFWLRSSNAISQKKAAFIFYLMMIFLNHSMIIWNFSEFRIASQLVSYQLHSSRIFRFSVLKSRLAGSEQIICFWGASLPSGLDLSWVHEVSLGYGPTLNCLQRGGYVVITVYIRVAMQGLKKNQKSAEKYLFWLLISRKFG